MQIRTKKHNYDLYLSGEYGNKPKTWNSVDELISSGWNKGVSVRSTLGMGRGKVQYGVLPDQLDCVMCDFESQGIPRSSLTFNESMPDDLLTIQGEVMRTQNGLYVLYSDLKKPMNVALKEKQMQANGITAKVLLERNLWSNSLDDLNLLLNKFSGNPTEESSVVEFSSYEVAVGNKSNRNTIIWEVRNY